MNPIRFSIRNPFWFACKDTVTHILCVLFFKHAFLTQAYSSLSAVALCHSDRQSVLMKAPLIHKPSMSMFDASQLSEGKRQPALPISSDISFHWIISFLENELHLLSAKFKFGNILSLVMSPGLQTETYSCVLPLFSLSFYYGSARLQAQKPLQDLKFTGSRFKLGHHLLATASLPLSTVYTSLLFVITPLI